MDHPSASDFQQPARAEQRSARQDAGINLLRMAYRPDMQPHGVLANASKSIGEALLARHHYDQCGHLSN